MYQKRLIRNLLALFSSRRTEEKKGKIKKRRRNKKEEEEKTGDYLGCQYCKSTYIWFDEIASFNMYFHTLKNAIKFINII